MNNYILDVIAELLSTETERAMARRTGLSREKIRRITHSMSFVLDWKVISALNALGYDITLVKITDKNNTQNKQ